jgi:hypothetical protein
MPRTLPRALGAVAALIVAAGMLLATAAPAGAAPRIIDPACPEAFGITGFIVISDPAEAVAGLPPQVTAADMSCIISTNAQQIYVYLNDSFAKFTSTIDSLLVDGWTVTRVLDDGTIAPFDSATLPTYETSTEGVTLSARRGGNGMAVFFTADAASSQFFAAGTFIIAIPLVGEAPATPSGTTANDPSSISDLKTIADSAPNAPQSGVLVVTASLLTLLLGVLVYLLSTVLSKRYG